MNSIGLILVLAGMAACVQAGPASFHHQSRFLEGMEAEEIERLEVAFDQTEDSDSFSLSSLLGTYKEMFEVEDNSRSIYNPSTDDVVFSIRLAGTTDFVEINAAATNVPTEFDATLDFVVITHGWTGVYPVKRSGSALDLLVVLADKIAAFDATVNIMKVDWTILSGGVYRNSKRHTKTVGIYLADLLKAMVSDSLVLLDLAKVHLVGTGLGAHMMGKAGEELSGAVGRITGLNPAGYMYQSEHKDNRLSIGDAVFVYVVHTDPILGYRANAGHMDVYVNGGLYQRGCKVYVAGEELCNHKRALTYFVESLDAVVAFSYECSNILSFLMGQCLGNNPLPFGYAAEIVTGEVIQSFMITQPKTPFLSRNVAVSVDTQSHLSAGRVSMRVKNADSSIVLDPQVIRFTDFKFMESGTVNSMFILPLATDLDTLTYKLTFVPYVSFIFSSFTIHHIHLVADMTSVGGSSAEGSECGFTLLKFKPYTLTLANTLC